MIGTKKVEIHEVDIIAAVWADNQCFRGTEEKPVRVRVGAGEKLTDSSARTLLGMGKARLPMPAKKSAGGEAGK